MHVLTENILRHFFYTFRSIKKLLFLGLGECHSSYLTEIKNFSWGNWLIVQISRNNLMIHKGDRRLTLLVACQTDLRATRVPSLLFRSSMMSPWMSSRISLQSRGVQLDRKSFNNDWSSVDLRSCFLKRKSVR